MLCSSLKQRMASLISISFLLLSLLPFHSDAGIVGVNYGRVADDLPSPAAVVNLLKSNGVQQVKLYDADSAVLRALAGTGIKVAVALPNENLTAAAASPSFALSWVRLNVAAFYPSTAVHAVAVGNEVFATPDAKNRLTSALVPAMRNVHSALASLRLDGAVKVSSPIALTALQSSYPPSSGSFRPDLAGPVIAPMLDFLNRTGSYLMVNAYPFFAYEANADVIPLDYALFRPNPGVADPATGLRYYSLLDAQLDAVFAAASRLGHDGLRIVVSETGWPSKGDRNETGAGSANAAAYNGNLVRRVLSGNAGTPLRPNADIDVYLFALFNEDRKPGPASERNYGLFFPNGEKAYDISLSLKGGGGAGGLRWQEHREKGRAPAGTGETWCVADAAAGRERLQAALDYACGEGEADCGRIQPGADCYDPNTVEAHASFAFNSYYQRKARAAGSCFFQGAAYVVSRPPKVGKCELPTRA